MLDRARAACRGSRSPYAPIFRLPSIPKAPLGWVGRVSRAGSRAGSEGAWVTPPGINDKEARDAKGAHEAFVANPGLFEADASGYVAGNRPPAFGTESILAQIDGSLARAGLASGQTRVSFNNIRRHGACRRSSGSTRCARYLIPTTIESGPIRCSTRVSVKPISRIHSWQSAPV